MSKYCATFRAVYDADDETSAAIIADQIRLNAESDLDTDEGDEVECTQVTSNGLHLTPDELMVLLRKTRNALIKTRWRPAYDEARELDRMIYSLGHGEEPAFAMAGYNHGDFMDLCERILMNGEEPDVSE